MYFITSENDMIDTVNLHWDKVRDEIGGNVQLRPVDVNFESYPFFLGLSATDFSEDSAYIHMNSVVFPKSEAKRLVYRKTNATRGFHQFRVVDDMEELDRVILEILKRERLALVGRQQKFYHQIRTGAAATESRGLFPILLAWVSSDIAGEHAVEFFHINKRSAKQLVYYDKPGSPIKELRIPFDPEKMFFHYLQRMNITPRPPMHSDNLATEILTQQLHKEAEKKKADSIKEIAYIRTNYGPDPAKAKAPHIVAVYADLLNAHTRKIEVLRRGAEEEAGQ